MLRGDLDDLAALRTGPADGSDGVVHLANKHDWTNMAATNAAERAAVETLADALVGSDRPLLVPASGVAALAPRTPGHRGRHLALRRPDSPRGGRKNLALTTPSAGFARQHAVRPDRHGMRDHGFWRSSPPPRGARPSPPTRGRFRAWSAVHRSDAARLVRWAREGTDRITAARRRRGGVPTREIAEAIAESLGVPVTSIAPEDAVEHFGFIGRFFALDMSASSNRTRELLGWSPTGPTLIEDIKAGAYTGA